MKSNPLRRRIVAALASVALALGLGVATAPAAHAARYTQVCVQSNASVYSVGILLSSGYVIELRRGQCYVGVYAIWTYGNSRTYIDAYGWVGPGQYPTPYTRTYIVR